MQEYIPDQGWQDPKPLDTKEVSHALKRGSEVHVFPATKENMEKAAERAAMFKPTGVYKPGKFKVLEPVNGDLVMISTGTTKVRAEMIREQLESEGRKAIVVDTTGMEPARYPGLASHD